MKCFPQSFNFIHDWQHCSTLPYNQIMQSENGRRVHGLASQSLEGGDYLKALQLTDEAMTIYQTDGDDAGFAEIQAMRMLVLNMFGDRTGDKKYYVLAMHTAMASL